jgi:hypothetical protein
MSLKRSLILLALILHGPTAFAATPTTFTIHRKAQSRLPEKKVIFYIRPSDDGTLTQCASTTEGPWKQTSLNYAFLTRLQLRSKAKASCPHVLTLQNHSFCLKPNKDGPLAELTRACASF